MYIRKIGDEMTFEELTVEEFRQFLDTHPLRTFIQTPEMASVRETLGYQTYYVGVKKEDKVVAATMMGSRKSHFGYLEFYAPRGILIDYEDKELLTYFTNQIKTYIRKKKGYVFRIDPYYITEEKDIDGKTKENGISHARGIENLKEVGYRKDKDIYQQFQLLFAMDLDSSKQDLFASFKTLPKRMIKRAENLPIEIRQVELEEIPKVQELIDETGKRKQFHGRKLSYYQELYKAFSPKKEIAFLVGELDYACYQENLEKELQDLNQQLRKVSKKEKTLEIENRIQKAKEHLEESKSMTVDERGNVLLSAGVFLLYSTELIYLFGGNKKEYMHLGSSYLMQWTMIQYGLTHGFTKYNFYGISSPTEEDGVYSFKRGFGGYVEELIGDYELPIRKYYYLEKLIRRLKK